MLDYSNIISVTELGLAVKEAARDGDINIIKCLLAYDRVSISPFYLGLAIEIAAKNGHIEIIKYLLAYDKVSISPVYLGLAIEIAAKNGHINVVEIITALDLNYYYYFFPRRKLEIMLKNAREQIKCMKFITFPANFPIKITDWEEIISIIERFANISEKLNIEDSIKLLGKINYALLRLYTDNLKVLTVRKCFFETEGMEQFTHIDSGPLFVLGEYLGNIIDNTEKDRLEKRFNELKQEVHSLQKYIEYEKRYQNSGKLSNILQKISNWISMLLFSYKSFIKTYFIYTNKTNTPTNISNQAQSSNAMTITTMPPPTTSAITVNVLTTNQTSIAIPSNTNLKMQISL